MPGDQKESQNYSPSSGKIIPPPKGIAIIALIGPSLIWCAEYIGSGEVILATRTGSILGTSVLWAIVLGIFLKYWIGMSGARYTVCTGEGMVDMFDRIPGPKHWAVWIVLIAQLGTAMIAIGNSSRSFYKQYASFDFLLGRLASNHFLTSGGMVRII